jgi:hypothetical protein
VNDKIKPFADYFIFSENNPDDLSSLVCRHLETGMKLYGSPFAHRGDFYQCMVKADDEDLK